MEFNKISIDNGLSLDGVRLRGVNEYSIVQNNHGQYIGNTAHLTLDMDVFLSGDGGERAKSTDITVYEKKYIGMKESTYEISFELPEHQFKILKKSKAWKEIQDMLSVFEKEVQMNNGEV